MKVGRTARWALLLPMAAAASGWVDHGDGTVSDPQGRIWKHCAEGQRWQDGRCEGEPLGHDWEEARLMAEVSRYAGHVDWRLPRHDELRALGSAPLDSLDAAPTWWSGTPVPHGSDGAFAVRMQADGAVVEVAQPRERHAVRLVRDP
jgi:hypothetical protein